LSIDPIQAVFSEPDRATTYSVPNVKSDVAGAKISYQWDLTLEAVDPNAAVDEGCNNHANLHGNNAVFVWHHGNIGDPVHDDGCSHTIYGKYGHQGLITVTVSDGAGGQCQETYKGTFSSDANSVANGVASAPNCTFTPVAPPPACKCMSLTARILPGTLKFYGHRYDYPLYLSFALHWTMSCRKGDGGCNGMLELVAPEEKANPKTGDKGYSSDFCIRACFGPEDHLATITLHCRGACATTSEGAAGFTLHSSHGLGPLLREFESIPIVIRRTCQGKKVPPIRLSIAFGRGGAVDLAKSKLH
jgi:hypothetical protein